MSNLSMLVQYILPFIKNLVKEVKVNSFDIEIVDNEGKKHRFLEKDISKFLKELKL